MVVKMYYCNKCKRKHKYDSKIGIKHLQENENPPEDQAPIEHITEETIQEDESLPVELVPAEHISEETIPDIEKPSVDLDPVKYVPEEIHQKVQDNEPPLITGNWLHQSILNYRRSYKRGVTRFGIWWKILQLSMWGIVLIFLVTAAIILVFFLPQIELIIWKLR